MKPETLPDKPRRKNAGDESHPPDAGVMDIFGSMGMGIILLDRDLRVTHLNPEAATFLGKPQKELTGELLLDNIPETIGEKLSECMCLALDGESRSCAEEYFPAPIGLWLNYLCKPYGEGIIIVLQDTGERKEMEKALDEANRTAEYNQMILDAVINQMPAGLIITDATGTKARNNKEMDRIWKRPMDPVENIDDHGYKAFHLEGREYRMEEWPLTRALQNGEVIIGEEMTIMRGDGTTGTVHVSSAPIRDKNGNIIAGIVIDVDITDSRKTLTALKESEERLRTLSNNLPDGVVYRYVIDAKGRHRFEYISASIERLTGISLRDVLRHAAALKNIIPPGDYSRMREAGRRSHEELSLFEQEVRVKHPITGEVRWCLTRSIPSRRPDGSTVWDGFLFDITERKKIEEERNRLLQDIDRERARLQAVIDSLPVGLWITDAEGKMVFVNDAARTIWGGNVHYAENTSEYSRYKVWQPGTGELIAAEDMPLARALRGETCRELTLEFERFNGTWGIQLASAAPVRTSAGTIIGGIAIVQDVTEHKQAEEALRKSEEQYRHIVEHAPTGIYEIDYEAPRFKRVNDAMCHALGYTREELLEMNPFDLLDEESRERFRERIGKVLTGEKIDESVSFRAFTKDGREIWSGLNVKLVYEEGRLAGALVIAHDITELKRIEDALRESEEKFRVLSDASPAAIIVYRGDRHLYVNQAAVSILGYKMEELISMNFTDLVHPYYRYVTRERAQAILKGKGRRDRYEVKVITKAGEEKWLDVSSNLISYEGAPAGIAICMDITERKKIEDELFRYREHLEELVQERTLELEAQNRRFQKEILLRTKFEEALRESEEKYRLVVDNANEAILVTQDGMFRFINPKAEELTGCAKEELIGQPIADFIHPEDKDLVLGRHYGRMEGEDVPTTYEFRMVDKEGNTKWLDMSSILVPWQGRPATLNFLFDITEWKKTEEEKKRIENQLMQAQKIEALDRFAGGIAHDLNNILYPIILNIEHLISETHPDSGQHEVLLQTLKAACRQRDLIRKILTFSRKNEPKFQPVRIVQLLEETMDFLRSSLPSTIELKLSVDVRTDTIMGDSTQIQQIIMNLCWNAADAIASKKGVIELHLRTVFLESMHTHQGLKAGEYLQLTVKDTGHGMKPEVMDRIFEPFFTTKETGKGTGLGLSVVHGIVKNHGGAITVESQERKGSLFIVHLPVCDTGIQPQTPYSGNAPCIQGKGNILLVDDEEAILSSLQRVLTESGYHVVAANDSMKAVRLFARDPQEFDIIITDLTMPKMTGIELARKALKIRPDIPVVLCTGFNDAINDQEAISLGIHELLLKPTDSRELKKTVRRALEQ